MAERYRILIRNIGNPRAKGVLAHYLADSGAAASIAEAFTALEHLPVPYALHMDPQEVARQIRKLKKLGVDIEVSADPAGGRKQTGQAGGAPPGSPAGTQEPSVHPRPRPFAARPAGGSMYARPSLPADTVPSWKRAGRILTPLAIILVLIGAVVFWARSGGAVSSGDNRPAGTRRAPAGDPLDTARPAAAGRLIAPDPSADARATPPAPVTHQKKLRSNSYLDSAAASDTDLERAIRFYRIAISFNQYNIHAWLGLVRAYEAAGMAAEKRTAEKQMRELFGEEIYSIPAIVGEYGTLMELSRSGDGTFRIEYRSKKSGKDDLFEETWRLAGRIRPLCACEALSVFAATGKSSGLIVHIPTRDFPSSARRFKDRSSVVWLE